MLILYISNDILTATCPVPPAAAVISTVSLAIMRADYKNENTIIRKKYNNKSELIQYKNENRLNAFYYEVIIILT